MSGTLAVMEMQTLGETLVEVEAKALIDSLFKKRQETLTQVQSEVLIDRLPRKVFL